MTALIVIGDPVITLSRLGLGAPRNDKLHVPTICEPVRVGVPGCLDEAAQIPGLCCCPCRGRWTLR